MLHTQNAGGLIAGSGQGSTENTVPIKMLIGTFIQSLKRHVAKGETVKVSPKDAAFLLPYKYAVRASASEAPAQAVAPVEVVEAAPIITEEVTEETTEEVTEETTEEVTEETTPQVSQVSYGKRRSGKRRG